MEKLAQVCKLCHGKGTDPASDPVGAPCRSCGGGKFELTDAGNEVRKLVIALLSDDEVFEALRRARLVDQTNR